MKTLIAVLALGITLTACGPSSGPAATNSEIYRGLSAPTLWAEIARTSDTQQIMLIEAELAARGQTASGGEYIGRRTSGTVGKRLYGRSAPIGGDRNCSDFSSPAEAQRFFLAAGGPVHDPHGLDRDGDGNACEWGRALQSSVSSYHRAVRASAARSNASYGRARSSSRCYVGPRGGTYTITASGNRNYGGC